MAYVSQEKKASLAPAIKALLKQYNLKGTLSVSHHSTLVLPIKSGKIDFIKNYNDTNRNKARPSHLPFVDQADSIQVNPYWCHEHFTGNAKKFLVAVINAMKGPDFFDESDSMTDYFHCSHYVEVNIGRWNKPYVVTK
jgi:hypothetical protein